MTATDTYVAEDTDGTPTLWLMGDRYPRPLISREGLRCAMRTSLFHPHAMAHVNRLWDAIAATAGEAPKDNADA